MLSGHSHGGQVTIPVIQDLILPPNGKKYYKEKYNFGNTTLFVSSGIGCSSFNYRFGVFPSINFYRIRKR